MKQRDQRLWEALQDFDTHKHPHADALVQELTQKYDVSAEDLRKAIDRGGLAATETIRIMATPRRIRAASTRPKDHGPRPGR